ncbi:MAG TPA: hypothetical protein VIE66_07435 [Methylocella sp.]|jgi:hypothetical protein
MADLTPSGYLGIDDAIAAFCERMYRNDPEPDLVQELRDSGLSIGSAERHSDAIEALRRAILRGSLEVFVWHSGMSATVKISDTALARLRMLDRRTFFLRTGHVRTADLADAGILGKFARSFSASRCFFEERAFRVWLDRRERRLRLSADGNLARPVALGRPSKIKNIQTMIVELVERGGWDRSKPLRHMVDLLNKRLITDRISADTVAKAIDDLYSETKDGRYDRRRKRNKKVNS